MSNHTRTNDFLDDPARQCAGKRVYESRRAAKTAISRMTGPLLKQFKPGSSRDDLHPYRCPHCQQIHIGGKR